MPSTVFVLGAGFTKSFADDAPLLVGDYYGDLRPIFDKSARGLSVLETERKRDRNGNVNLENLMSRLAEGMPYDVKTEFDLERRLLLANIKKWFRERLFQVKVKYQTELKAFARYCKMNRINCITFNYDDFLDRELNKDNSSYDPKQWWHPHWGYGFFCPSSAEAVHAFPPKHRSPLMAMLLLKLHGSVNWRIRHGHPPPYGADALMHHEDWWTAYDDNVQPEARQKLLENIGFYLEQEPFMVPPVLTKSDLVEQPILRLLWSQAFGFLSEAEKVTFVGYSLPITDMAAGTMFREAFSRPDPPRAVFYCIA